MSNVAPLSQPVNELSPETIEELRGYAPFDRLSASHLSERGLGYLAAEAFPLYSLSQETQYFAASITAALMRGYPHLDQLPTHISIDSLVLTQIGDIKIPPTLVRECVQKLMTQQVIPKNKDYISISSIDLVLDDILHEAFDQQVHYADNVIFLEERRVQRKKNGPVIHDRHQYIFDDKNLAEIYQEYVPRLRGHIMKIVKNKTTTEDIVQDVFVRAMRFAEKYEQGTNLQAWLYTIATNLAINYFRREKRREEKGDNHPLLGSEPAITPENNSSFYQTPEEELSHKESQARVLQVIDTIPPLFKDVVLLREVDDLSYKEIAEKLHLPVGTVMSRLYRGRESMRLSLAGYAMKVSRGEKV